MFIEMLDTRRGSEDGFSVKRFYEGRKYDMRDSLAREFIRNGYAKRVTMTETDVMNEVHNKLHEIFRGAICNPATDGFGEEA